MEQKEGVGAVEPDNGAGEGDNGAGEGENGAGEGEKPDPAAAAAEQEFNFFTHF